MRTVDPDDESFVYGLARRAVRAAVSMFLLFTLAGAAALVYLKLVGDTRAEAASGLRMEVLAGACRYGKVGNYVWYNEHYEHALDMTGGCGLIAVSRVGRNAGTLHLGWRLAYVDTGAARTNAVFPMRDEEQISVLPDGSSCDPVTWFGCTGRGKGAQRARGISAGWVAERDFWHATWGTELGLFVYEGAWRVHIAPEAPSDFQRVTFNWQGWQLTPFVGASVRYGHAMAMLRAYGRIRAAEHGCGVCSGVANGTLVQALIGASIPF